MKDTSLEEKVFKIVFDICDVALLTKNPISVDDSKTLKHSEKRAVSKLLRLIEQSNRDARTLNVNQAIELAESFKTMEVTHIASILVRLTQLKEGKVNRV